MNLLRQRGIRFWATAFIIIVSLTTTILFVILSYISISKSLNNQYINESRSVLDQTTNYFELQFSNVQNILDNLSQDLTDESINIDEVLQSYQHLTLTSSQILFGLENGQYYLSMNQILPATYTPVEQEWYKNAGGNNEISWTEPYFDNIAQENIISTSKAVNFNGMHGVVAINFNLDEISTIISHSKIGKDGLVMLLSNNGTVLANRDNRLIGESLFGNQFDEILEKSNKEQVPFKINDQTYFIHTEKVLQNGMSILAAINEQELHNSLNKSLLPIVIAGIGCLLLFSILAYMIILRGVKPLKKLATLLSYVELGNYNVYAKERDYLEVYRLTNGFNSMIRAIKKRDRELQLAYSEIKDTEEQLRHKYEQLKASEEKILHLASYDSLTGLLNRRSLLQVLNKSILSHKNNSLKAIIFIDVDNFKTVNDSLGHSMGDKLIVEVGNKLNSISHNNKDVARISGDEFILIIHDLESEMESERIANEIIHIFEEPILIDSKQMNITLSIGIALFPIHASTTEELLKIADMSMYQVKGSGKNGYKIFDEGIKREADQKVETELGIRDCLNNNEFELVFQPLYNTTAKRITNIEALLRSKSPSLKKFNIAQIIQTAEITGQIIEIDKWVLREACLTIQEINREVKEPIHISVNISALHIMQQEFVHNVKEIIDQTGVQPEWLELEITETSLMESFDSNIQKLHELKKLGISLHLDDFGTGYSSLNYLNSLPIDHVKIDKSFIDLMLDSEKDSKIVETIISLSHNIGLQVVAEGVEHNEQFEMLMEYQCELIQGYYISKPVKFEQIISIIQQTEEICLPNN